MTVLLVVVARCQLDSDVEAMEALEEEADLGIVGERISKILVMGVFSPALGVDIVCFPKEQSPRFCTLCILLYNICLSER